MGICGIYKMESGSWVVKRKKGRREGFELLLGIPSADIGLMSGDDSNYGLH